MKEYSIDLDIIKQIFLCKGVGRVDWRISASGRGFHFTWTCTKRTCKHCGSIERSLDDQKRYRHDYERRPSHHRRILWSNKGGRTAGPWKTVVKQKESK